MFAMHNTFADDAGERAGIISRWGEAMSHKKVYRNTSTAK